MLTALFFIKCFYDKEIGWLIRRKDKASGEAPQAFAAPSRDVHKGVPDREKAAIVPKGNQRNIPHPRYKGKIGTVIEKRGSAYVVELRIFNTTKKLVVPVEHLEKATASAKARSNS